MIILREFKLLQKFVGLDRQSGFDKIISRLIYLIALFSSDLTFPIFFVSNIHDNMHASFTALPEIIGFTLYTANYLHLLTQRERFGSLLDELQGIVDERVMKYSNEMIYIRTEHRASIVTKVIIYAILLCPILSLSPFALAAYDWCLGKFTLNSWIFFYPAGAPIELNSTFRCAFWALYGIFIGTIGVLLMSLIPCLLFGFMLYLKAIVMDIKTMFNQMNCLSKPQKSKRSEQQKINSDLHQTDNTELEMFELCKEIVALHQKVNRLLYNLADVTNFFVLVTIVLWTICICIALFLIEKYDGSRMVYDLQVPFLAVIIPLNLLATLCYLGQEYNKWAVTNLSGATYQSEWYQYPHKIQRLVLLMMMRSQRSFHLSAYGIMELHLEHFVVLLKWIYSAFMVLHRVD